MRNKVINFSELELKHYHRNIYVKENNTKKGKMYLQYWKKKCLDTNAVIMEMQMYIYDQVSNHHTILVLKKKYNPFPLCLPEREIWISGRCNWTRPGNTKASAQKEVVA